MAKCSECRGKGYIYINEAETCPNVHFPNVFCGLCLGKGVVQNSKRRKCPDCLGTGRNLSSTFPSFDVGRQTAAKIHPAAKSKKGCIFWLSILFFLFLGLGFLSDKYKTENNPPGRNTQINKNISNETVNSNLSNDNSSEKRRVKKK
jgi:hypothetical protein